MKDGTSVPEGLALQSAFKNHNTVKEARHQCTDEQTEASVGAGELGRPRTLGSEPRVPFCLPSWGCGLVLVLRGPEGGCSDSSGCSRRHRHRGSLTCRATLRAPRPTEAAVRGVTVSFWLFLSLFTWGKTHRRTGKVLADRKGLEPPLAHGPCAGLRPQDKGRRQPAG